MLISSKTNAFLCHTFILIKQKKYLIYYSAKFIEFPKNIFVNFFYNIFQMFSQKSIENASSVYHFLK